METPDPFALRATYYPETLTVYNHDDPLTRLIADYHAFKPEDRAHDAPNYGSNLPLRSDGYWLQIFPDAFGQIGRLNHGDSDREVTITRSDLEHYIERVLGETRSRSDQGAITNPLFRKLVGLDPLDGLRSVVGDQSPDGKTTFTDVTNGINANFSPKLPNLEDMTPPAKKPKREYPHPEEYAWLDERFERAKDFGVDDHDQARLIWRVSHAGLTATVAWRLGWEYLDIAVHYPYEREYAFCDECEYLTGGQCWAEVGSGLYSRSVYTDWVASGRKDGVMFRAAQGALYEALKGAVPVDPDA